MAVKLYTQQHAGQLPDLFERKAKFMEAFGGTPQTLQGAEAQDDYLKLKISDTDVVIQDYSTDPNVAFGDGTGNSNRFGKRHEVKSTDIQVPFDTPLAIHEGIDSYTVNDIPTQVIAERLALHTTAWADHADGVFAQELSDKAGKSITGDLTEEGVINTFNEARRTFVNNKVSNTVVWYAFVTSDVFNMLVDSDLAKTDKNSTVNIDNGVIYRFKGFQLVEVEDEKFKAKENIYFVPANVGVASVAIPVSRTIDSEDFAGVTIQSAGKLGKYIPEKNKKAIVKAKLAVPKTPASES